MTTRIEMLIWISAAALVASALAVALGMASTSAAWTQDAAVIALLRRDSSSRDGAAVVASDPFRLARQPSPVRFEPGRRRHVPEPEIIEPVAPPKPQLIVRGIVGGPPWQALLDGLPGRAATLVRTGDTLGEIVIRSIGRDTVVVAGMDTTWRLGVNRAWR